MKRHLLNTVAFGALYISFSATPALSQDGGGEAASAVPGDAGSVIVVTARKREETLQDVPIAVSAVSGEMLESQGLAQAEDLFSVTPGLFYSQRGQRNNDEQFFLTIRGVGSSPVVEPSVGLFVDGVYVPSLGWSSDFLDLERVEVLRGPQGSLFGRNTQAGALNIVTREPSDFLEGKLLLEAADFDSYKAQASISGPLSDNISARLSGFVSTTDGYVYNAVRDERQDNRDKFGGRLRITADLGGDTELDLTADYFSSEGRFNALGDADPSLAFTVADPNAGVTGTGVFAEAHALAGRRYTTFANDEQTIDTESYGLGATLNKDFGGVALTSITGYRFVEAQDLYDVDGVGALVTNSALTRQEILSQEMRLTSDGTGPFQWITGFYLFTEELEQRRNLDGTPQPGGPNILINVIGPGAPVTTRDNVLIERDGFALFGQGTYSFTDKLDLTVGLRYAYEAVKQTPDLTVNALGGAINVRNTTRNSDSFDGFSPMASLRYQWSDDVMTYATVSTGFKAGGFTKEIPNTPGQNVALDNETSINYEVGLKSQFLDRRVLLNAALFWTELKDVQLSTRVNISDDPAVPIFQPATTNAGEARTRGFEVELGVRPTDFMNLRGNVAYVDSEFLTYIQVPADGATLEYDRSGQSLPEVPDWTASATLDFRIPLGGMNAELVPLATVRYVDNKFIGDGTVAAPFLEIDSYTLVDAQLSLELDNVTFTAFADNLFDKYYAVNKLANQPILSVPGQRAYLRPGSPRKVGARVSFRW